MKEVDKKLDVICMGRVAVDLYGDQIGSRLEDMTTFAKYLGGSSGNVAYGTAIQGLKSGMLARVGDEHMGRFVREELIRAGVDVSHLITDKDRLTALVLLGIKDEDTFPLIFYRDNCADMAITSDDVSESYIASSRCLAITGTHLSNPSSREAVLTALSYARKHGVKTALDIDYRPVLWGLTSLGDGETRFIESDSVTQSLQDVLHYFDLIVGTEEEFHIAGGSTDTVEALKGIRNHSKAELVCKRGPMGCSVFTTDIPETLDEGITVKGVRVDVLNVLGAGDAFMSGLLRGYLNGESWEQSCNYANACGALVVSRHGCAPAMPTKAELDYYITHAENIPRPDVSHELNHLHRVTKRAREWQDICVLAFDHRAQFAEMALEANREIDTIPYIKSLIWQAYCQATEEAGLQGKSGILCDGTFGQHVLNQATGIKENNDSMVWIGRPIEQPSSRPLMLEHGNIGSQLVNWPQEHIVKCLVFYHPNDEQSLKLQQQRDLQEIYQACCQSGHELLLEIILPKDSAPCSPEEEGQLYTSALSQLYDLGIKPDWWKLPSIEQQGWRDIDALIEQQDPYCRGIVLLGLDAPLDQLAKGFQDAAQSKNVQGFAVGRSIFGEPTKQWLKCEIDDETFISKVKNNYHQLVSVWQQRHS